MWEIGILDGVTTNPTLVAKEGRKFEDVIREICALGVPSVSAEVVGTTTEVMLPRVAICAQIHPSIYVKVPMTAAGLKATKILASEGTRVNMTLVFSANQALLAAKVGAAYVSPFIGRLDDQGQDGMELIDDIVTIYENYDYRDRGARRVGPPPDPRPPGGEDRRRHRDDAVRGDGEARPAPAHRPRPRPVPEGLGESPEGLTDAVVWRTPPSSRNTSR